MANRNLEKPNMSENHNSGRKSTIGEVHRVKSWPIFFEAALAGDKTHDLRRCDDRNFRVGDTLFLCEYDPKTELYTGRELAMRITYITSADSPCALSDRALDKSFCILSIQKLSDS